MAFTTGGRAVRGGQPRKADETGDDRIRREVDALLAKAEQAPSPVVREGYRQRAAILREVAGSPDEWRRQAQDLLLKAEATEDRVLASGYRSLATRRLMMADSGVMYEKYPFESSCGLVTWTRIGKRYLSSEGMGAVATLAQEYLTVQVIGALRDQGILAPQDEVQVTRSSARFPVFDRDASKQVAALRDVMSQPGVTQSTPY